MPTTDCLSRSTSEEVNENSLVPPSPPRARPKVTIAPMASLNAGLAHHGLRHAIADTGPAGGIGTKRLPGFGPEASVAPSSSPHDQGHTENVMGRQRR